MATYKVQGMHCASCKVNIEKRLAKQPGVKAVQVNFATEEATVDFDEHKTNRTALSKAIEPLGYMLEEQVMMPSGETMSAQEHAAMGHGDNVQHSSHGEDHSQHTATSDAEIEAYHKKVCIVIPLVVLSAAAMLWTIFSERFPLLPALPETVLRIMDFVMLVIATYVMFSIGQPYIRGVVTFLRHGVASMDSLVGIGTLTAYVYSVALTIFASQLKDVLDVSAKYFDVTIIVIGFITLGKYLEVKSKRRTGDAIKQLLGLQVKMALVIREGSEVELPIDQVRKGDLIMVKPGMKIPVDGVITKGTSNIDESMLTGEPIPASKQVNDTVAAGTINISGSFVMETTQVGSETLLAHIIKMVREAQGSRAPIQKLADRISAIFVPTVLAIAVLTLIGWLVVGSRFMPFTEALRFGIVNFVGVLVIACPCALGLATPTAIIVGVGKGATQGILIKNAEVLEKLHRVTTLVIDKTGTITTGKPKVVSVVVSESQQEEAVLRALAALEEGSEHPLAASIVASVRQRYSTTDMSVATFENVPGQGVRGTIDNTRYWAGSPKFIAQQGIAVPQAQLAELLARGVTPVVFARTGQWLAIVGVGDTLKPEARAAIAQLRAMKIHVVMATGDHQKAAEHFAQQVGIDAVFAEASPKEKRNRVQALQKDGAVVAMAGDGVNDAPALAQSDVGIAMGTGTDVSIETSDVTLLHGDITRIAQAIYLSRATMATIKQNLFWAFIYNAIGIPLAAGVFYPFFGWLLSPVFAGLAMALSSVSVVTNSLRLKTKRLT